jgi:radical SAM protein with 4Fe4S-binding SPASM domain
MDPIEHTPNTTPADNGHRHPVPIRATRRVAGGGTANACYFRSGADPGRRKALLQITERCDLRCAHCFVSATHSGSDMTLEDIAGAIPRLEAARVSHVTLTGGEPFVHPAILRIVELLVHHEVSVTICTNAVSVSSEQIDSLVQHSGVGVNVSLDGFSSNSHGQFRGDRSSFDFTVANARKLADAGLLKGILCTPNTLAEQSEYAEVYRFAQDVGAEYVLMNPLSSFGRGTRAGRRLRADDRTMRSIQADVQRAASAPDGPEAVFIRFPNDSQPLSGCVAGEVVYVFVNGDTAVCPYLVFAAKNAVSRHTPDEFIAGNLFRDEDFAARLDVYDFHRRYTVPNNPTCWACGIKGSCGNGCPAAVVASGGRIGDLDADVCPRPEAQ